MNEELPPSEMPDELLEMLERYSDLMEAGLYSEADEASSELMEYVAAEAEQTLPFDRDMQEGLQAHLLAEAGEWRQAERIYKERLTRARKEGNSIAIHSACKSLVEHHSQLGELDLAAMYMAEVIHTARQQGAMAETMLWSLLPVDANLACQQGRFESAVASLDEALSYLPEDRVADHTRASILIDRAYAKLKLRDFAGAEADHREAWERLGHFACMETAPGIQSTFAEWWFVEAALWEHERDFEQADHAWEQALAYRRRTVELWDEGSPHMLLPLAAKLFSYGQYLRRRGERRAAAECFEESDRIRTTFRLAPLSRETDG